MLDTFCSARDFVRSWLKLLLLIVVVLSTASGAVLVHYYAKYSRMIDARLSGQVFKNTAKIYAAPQEQLVTTLFDASREKRRLVEFEDIPRVVVQAVTAGEDRTFFTNYGLSPVRIAGAFISNLHQDRSLQGGSTITQQLARNFFLTPSRTWHRKISEAFIAVILDQRLSKQQIFTMYSNEVYLGQSGSFAIHGFGEGAAMLFGKPLGDLTLTEAATLAGIIPAPNADSPVKHPERAIARRNLILRAMHEEREITDIEYQQARQAGLTLTQATHDVADASYMIDYIREELSQDYSEDELMSGNLNVYTTIDPKLQMAAVEAVQNGFKLVAEQLAKRKVTGPLPQAGLIALDPHTGEIKAMVGGTDYDVSQYNRITRAFRQPGSAFKPFVYASALETAFDNAAADDDEAASTPDSGNETLGDRVITSLTTVMDEPTTFTFNDNDYEPNNFKHEYLGLVTLRTALMHSLNVPAIKIAERIGYNRVAAFAKRLGLNANIRGYPSLALGAFEVTPLELAGAYTAFANEGNRIEPHALLRVEAADGSLRKAYHFEPKPVIRPEIAYLVTDLMEGVIDHGTGAGVRSRGFRLPAAGKTGTSRDGWFVGYTKDLLVIAWVGFDDNRDLNLEGARSALPIWADFMIKAYQIYPVHDVARMAFNPPLGIEIVSIDTDSRMLATPDCQHKFDEAFIAGTAPTEYCPIHAAAKVDP